MLYLFLGFVEELKGYGADKKRVDAIVVLTGGTGRADLGLELLRQGLGGVLILSGVNRDADVDSIFLTGLAELERLSVILEKKSESTFENAMEVTGILSDRHLRSMLLVTSRYHMKRAQFIFKRIMPGDIDMLPYTVPSPEFNREWWKGKGFITAFGEFVKYYWYYLRFSFEDLGF
jgi:uncharacterized SAM-binding protein YcdF (DUF218 family)